MTTTTNHTRRHDCQEMVYDIDTLSIVLERLVNIQTTDRLDQKHPVLFRSRLDQIIVELVTTLDILACDVRLEVAINNISRNHPYPYGKEQA